MKVELDADIVDHITLQGLKELKKWYKDCRDKSYTAPVVIWNEQNRDREYALNNVFVKAVNLVKSQYEVGVNSEKLFEDLIIACDWFRCYPYKKEKTK